MRQLAPRIEFSPCGAFATFTVFEIGSFFPDILRISKGKYALGWPAMVPHKVSFITLLREKRYSAEQWKDRKRGRERRPESWGESFSKVWFTFLLLPSPLPPLPLVQTPCLDSFLPWEVVPCKDNDRSAIYELDENGEAYDNLYQLRKVSVNYSSFLDPKRVAEQRLLR